MYSYGETFEGESVVCESVLRGRETIDHRPWRMADRPWTIDHGPWTMANRSWGV